MCKGFKFKRRNYQPGYPVIKKSKYTTSSMNAFQTGRPSKQYPTNYNLDSTKIWHLSKARFNGRKDTKYNTKEDINNFNKNNTNLTVAIEVSSINDPNQAISNKNNNIWLKWTNNFYYPLIENDLDEEFQDKIENLEDKIVFHQMGRSLATIDEKSETMAEDNNTSLPTSKKLKPAVNNPVATGMTTRSQTSASTIKQSIGNFVMITKKLSTVKTATSNQGSTNTIQKQIKNKGTEFDTTLDVSTKYIPRKMPHFTSIIKHFKEDDDEDNDHDVDIEKNLSMVIKIDRRKNKHLEIDNRRVFIAVSKALQYFAPDLKLALFNSDEDLLDFDKAPTNNDELLEKYIMNPTTSKNYVYTVKYHYRSFISFHRIMHKNEELKRWLRSEGIMLELNSIKETNLVNVGFYIKCHPRASILEAQVNRITSKIQQKTPEFMAYNSQIYSEGNQAGVIMIKSGVDDVTTLVRLLKSEKNTENYRFIEWSQWDALDSKYKNDIIRTQLDYLNTYASIILKGFADNDDIPMNYGSDLNTIMSDEWKNLGEMTVSQFLCHYYETVSGDPLIEGCFPPSLGVRELIVLRSRNKQCIKWAKVVKSEMYKLLSASAQVLIFKNPSFIEKESQRIYESWSGNTLELEFSPITIENNNKRSFKKFKQQKDEKSKPSYSAVLQNTHNTPKLVNQTNMIPPINNNVLLLNHQSAVITEMQTQIKALNMQSQEYSMELSVVKSSVATTNKDLLTMKTEFNNSLNTLSIDTSNKINEVHSVALNTNNIVTVLAQQQGDLQKMMIQQGINIQAHFDRANSIHTIHNKENNYNNINSSNMDIHFATNFGDNRNACNEQRGTLSSLSAPLETEQTLVQNQSITNHTNTIDNILPTQKYLIEDYFPSKHNTRQHTNNITKTNETNQATNDLIAKSNKEHNGNETNETTTNIKRMIQQRILTTNNIINERWGSPIEYKPPNHSRIYFQNVNSLRYTDQGYHKWINCCNYMQEIQCDVFGLAESCIDWKSKNIKSTFQSKTNTVFKNASLSFSNNNFPLTSPYLPGGTIQTATRHWAGKVTEVINDDTNMGRWTGQSFRLKDNYSLTIITAYRPGKHTSTRSSTRTTYQQQYIMLRDKGFINPNPRSHFTADLIKLIRKLEQNPKKYIVIMMDANESSTDEEGSLCRIFNETSLVDTFTNISNEKCNISTYVRGSKRIDYILTTANMIPYISQAGYLPFYEDHMDSDHRGSFIDIDNKLLDNIIENKRPPKRNIGSKSAQHEIIDYLRYVDQQFRQHNIYDRTSTLYNFEQLGDNLNDNNCIDTMALQNLDNQITEITLSSEKRFCKSFHESEWSLALHYTAIEIRYWMTKYKASMNKRDVMTKLHSLLHQLPISSQQIINQSQNTDPKILWRSKIKYKKELIKHAKELRQKGLQELSAIRAKEGNCETSSIIQKIAKVENGKQNWEILARTFKPNIRSGINYLEVPHKDKNDCDTNDVEKAKTWKIITDPLEINERLITRNIEHFGQAHGNEFTINPLLELLQYEGSGPHIDMLMEGRYDNIIDNASSSKGTSTLLHKINSTNKLEGIDDNISFDEWLSALKAWSERTTTSPSGRHLGHLKVCLAKIRINKDNENIMKAINDMNPDTILEEMQIIQTNILKVYYELSMTCLHQGISILRWQNVTTAMIKKDPHISKINKLRVIHLYEADYNLLLKILWAKRLVWHAHDNNRINSGQAGSRPGCNAIDIVTLKEMKYLHSRLTRTNLATMDNDAKSCYDRIICNLAMIISRLYGMTPRACRLQGTTLKKMQFRLRTAIGDSTNTYTHTKSTPIHGTGQGSCASPAIWLLISSILMDCLSEMAGGMIMQDVINDRTLREWINGFVDDTSLFCNIKNNDINELRKQLQYDMSIWQDLLEASGGKLELSKCFYYILSWKFNHDGDAIPMTIAEQLQTTIPISIDTSQSQVTIIQKESNESHKTLGCMKSIDGNEASEVRYLKAKAIQYTQQLKNAQLSKLQARMAYNCIFIPSLRYGLPSFSLTKLEIDSIQKLAVEQFIRAMGYEKSFPRDLVYAHQDFGGLQLPHLYSEMTAMKLETLTAHIRANSALGQALIININTIQLLSGSIMPILEHNINLNYLDDNWIMHLRAFIFEINSSIHIKDIWLPQLQREHDICLMDIFREKTNLNQRQLTLVNYWRIYFQVSTLSEICEPCDNQKIQYIFTKETNDRESKQQTSLFHWPHQQKPGKKGFLLWIYCLKQCFNYNPRNRKITWKLGKWLKTHNINNKWDMYIDIDSQIIYQTTSNGYNCYLPIISRTRTSTYNRKDIINHVLTIPEGAIPTHVISQRNISICQHSISESMLTDKIIDKYVSVPLHWKEYISQLEQWQQQFLKHSHISNEDILLASLSSSKDILIISDGGTTTTTQGTFGTIISNNEEEIYESFGKCYNNFYYTSSYRSECQAILSGLLSIHHLRQFFAININPQQNLFIYCDNKKLLRNLVQYTTYNMTVNDHNKPDYDVIIEIITLLKLLKPTYNSINFRHVKSKKAGKSDQPLTHEQQMHKNVHDSTQQAKFLKDVKYIPMPSNKVNIMINKNYVNSNIGKVAKKCYHSINARSFLQEKYHWNNRTTDNIWWNVHAKSLTKLLFHDRIRIQKFIHNHCNTNNREHQYYDHKPETCSSCFQASETEDHILFCKTISRRKLRTTWINEIMGLDHKTIPIDIRKAMSVGLKYWLQGSKTTTPNIIDIKSKFSPDIQLAFQHQSDIGWNHFVRGRLSITWGNILNKQFRNKHYDVEKWGSKIVDINLKYLLAFWEDRCKTEHGITQEEQESKLKMKLLNDIYHMQHTSHSDHTHDAKILHHDFEELKKLNCKQLKDWLIGARIIYNLCKKKINNTHLFSTDVDKLRNLEIDPG